MQMITGCHTGLSHYPDYLTCLYPISYHYVYLAQMPVATFVSRGMRDGDILSQSCLFARKPYNSFTSCVDELKPFRTCQVNPVMHSVFPIHRMIPHPELRGNVGIFAVL